MKGTLGGPAIYLFALLLAFCLCNPLDAQSRTALVIGNGAYASSPLRNTVNDAVDVSAVLKKVGFNVTSLTNASREQMERAIRDFGLALRKGGTGLFYYAGHGVQVKGRNYLIPVGVDIQAADEVAYMAVDADQVLSKMESAGNETNIVIMDACRNNPFPGSERSAERGLAIVGVQPPGSLIVYATGPGKTAADGSGGSRNGIFTRNFLKHLSTPGLEVSQFLRRVRADVMAETSNAQVPWDNSSLVKDFYFAGEAKPAAATVPAVQPAPQPAVAVRTPEGMVLVEGGTFSMGYTAGGGNDNEKPVHQVTVSSFYLARTELTQKEFRDVMGFNPSEFKGDTLPVERVSWYDAVAFCNEKSRREGLRQVYSISGIQKKGDGNITKAEVNADWNANGYRLPTEAEWEYAAKGGKRSSGYKYAGGNDPGSIAWYKDNSGKKTQAVGTKQPNELGLYDMSGNVWEWCWDWYGSYGASSQTDPRGASSGTLRVVRGGSWYSGDDVCRSANRNWDVSVNVYIIGFRPVRSTP